MYPSALLSTAIICVLFPVRNDVSTFSPIISRFGHLTFGKLVGGLSQQDGLSGTQRKAHLCLRTRLAFQIFCQDMHETVARETPVLVRKRFLSIPLVQATPSRVHLQLHAQTYHPSSQPDRHHRFTEQRCAKLTFFHSHVFFCNLQLFGLHRKAAQVLLWVMLF